MEFSPEFELLLKVSNGLPKVPISEAEVAAVSRYLGIDFPDVNVEDRVPPLSKELSAQNAFLSIELSSNYIYHSKEYRQSMFVR